MDPIEDFQNSTNLNRNKENEDPLGVQCLLTSWEKFQSEQAKNPNGKKIQEFLISFISSCKNYFTLYRNSQNLANIPQGDFTPKETCNF